MDEKDKQDSLFFIKEHFTFFFFPKKVSLHIWNNLVLSFLLIYGGVAQLVERQTHILYVRGPTPCAAK